MTERVRTLVLAANGSGWKAVMADTVLEGVLGIRTGRPLTTRNRLIRRLFGRRYDAMSYGLDWQDALCGCPDLEVEVCNVLNQVAFRRSWPAIESYPLTIVLHTAFGDALWPLRRAVKSFEARRGKLAVFIGNEYDLMAEKSAFLREVGADFICTQLPIEAARAVYSDCKEAVIVPMPHALNPDVYRPMPNVERTIDVGFIGSFYHKIIGDTERTEFIRYVQRNAGSLGIRFDTQTQRLPRSDWAAYLHRSKGLVGAESGTYYLDKEGRAVAAAKAYTRAHPQAKFEEVFEKCFKHADDYVSGKAISSRHFEPIGTKTCQVLLEGHYNGILRADEHYISVKKDLSDVREAFARFRDESERRRIVETAYEYALGNHTYAHRIRALVDIVHANVPQARGADSVYT